MDKKKQITGDVVGILATGTVAGLSKALGGGPVVGVDIAGSAKAIWESKDAIMTDLQVRTEASVGIMYEMYGMSLPSVIVSTDENGKETTHLLANYNGGRTAKKSNSNKNTGSTKMANIKVNSNAMRALAQTIKSKNSMYRQWAQQYLSYMQGLNWDDVNFQKLIAQVDMIKSEIENLEKQMAYFPEWLDNAAKVVDAGGNL